MWWSSDFFHDFLTVWVVVGPVSITVLAATASLDLAERRHIVDAGPDGSAAFFGSGRAQDAVPFIIAQAPSAHIAAQGASERMTGARPIAVSQFQPSAIPAATAAMPVMICARRLSRQAAPNSRQLGVVRFVDSMSCMVGPPSARCVENC